MKPVPIAIGAVVAIVVVVAIAVFMLTGGDGEPMDTAAIPPESAESPMDQNATPSATQPAGPGAETALQVGGQAGDQAGGAPGQETLGLPQQLQEQEGLPTLPWQADDLTDLEQSVAESLAVIEGAAPRAAWVLVDADWLADEMTLTDSLAVTLIRELAETEPALAGQVASLPWLADELDDEEARALSAIGNLAGAGPETLAAALETEWLKDGIAEEDLFTLAILGDIAGEDPPLARRMAESPELADGISGVELAAFTGSDNYYLERIERDHPDLAEIVQGYAWLSDSASLNVGSRGPDLLASPLLNDGLTNHEWSVLNDLSKISNADEQLGLRVASWPWLSDGVTQVEARALWRLAFIARKDVSAARSLAELPWLADSQLTGDELIALKRVARLLHTPTLRDLAELLIDQPWFQDSISGGEAAVLRVMETGCTIDALTFPENFARQLIENAPVWSRTLTLPNGEINLHLVSRNPLGADADTLFQESHNAVSALVEFMDQSWEPPDFTVYIEPEYRYISDGRGFYVGDFVMVGGSDEIRTLYHELAHHYSKSGPKWLSEGGANFLADYISSQQSGEGFMSGRLEFLNQRHADGCDGARNLHERNLGTGWMTRSMWFAHAICDYRLGEEFLLALYVNLGHEMVAGSLQELHRDTRFPGGDASEEVIYQVMLSHVPPGREAEFQEIYDRYHGRPRGYVHQPPPATGDRGALIALYNAAGGPGWERQRLWLTDAPIALWQGVHTRYSDVSRDIDPTGSSYHLWKGEDLSGPVLSLNLSYNNLSGRLPPELGNLASLESLGLLRNRLSGPIPPELGNLVNLEGLALSSNQLSGPIPPELGNLVGLTHLSLGNNQLSGPIPAELGNLTNLETLPLINNQLSGPIPPELGNLTNLRELGLGGNQLTGEIPAELANLTRLSIFSLSGNRLTGCVPGGVIPQLTRQEFTALGLPACGEEAVPLPAAGDTEGDQAALMALYHATGGPNWTYPQANPNVHWNPDNPLDRWYGVRLDGSGRVREIVLYQVEGVVGQLPPEIGNLTGLQWISIENSDLSGPLPPGIGNLVNLEILDLSGNQLSGSLPPGIGNLVNMETLDLSDNQLSGSLPPGIGNLVSIENLILKGNQLSGPLPPEMGNLVSLKVLRLNGNPFSGEIPSEFANLTNLEDLSYLGTQLTGCLPGDLPRMGLDDLSPCLDEGLAQGGDAALLLAIHNSLPGGLEIASDRPVTEWAGVTFNEEGRIVELQLSISSELDKNVPIPREVAQFTELEQLKILGGFTGQIPSEIGSLTKLEHLWIGQFTKLTGPLPPALGRLTNLTRLDLSNNQFGSPLPPEIGNLTSLKIFYANNAGLTGPLPPELGNLVNLESLDLSDNQLSGPLPPELGNLASLEYLRLRNNQLTGPIPPELGELGNLEELRLGGNELTGCIPLPLANKRNLSTDTCRDGQ